MDEIILQLNERWPEYAILPLALLIIAKLYQSQLAFLVPQVVKDYFAERAKLRADQQEHEQLLRTQEANVRRLKEMSQMSSLSFTEEQLTQMAAETQVQLNEANSFIRSAISDKLDMILEKQDTILFELRRRNGEKNIGLNLSNADTRKFE